MKIVTILASVALAGFVVTGASAKSATTAANGSTMAKKTTTMSPEKAAVSKKCSAEADAKKLHGKARQKFRYACKKSGGKAS